MALAPTLYNPGKSGQDARYDVSGLPRNANGRLTDGTYEYDDNGLDLSGRPPDYSAQWGADEMGPNNGGGGATGGGSSDAIYQQMMQELRSQGISDQASRDAGIKRSFINFGLSNFDLQKAAQTTGIGDLATILDQQTMQLAANNPFSIQRRLEKAREDRLREIRVALRQRGGSRSGESGFLQQKALTDFETDQFDSAQKLLDYISGAQAAYAAAERQRQQALWNAALDAANRRRNTPGPPSPPRPPSEPPAAAPPYVPSWSDNQYEPGKPTPFRSPRDFLNL
jgi:hypothetical protein